MTHLGEQIQALLVVQDEAKRFLADTYNRPHRVHVVLPDPDAGRVPWIEVRLVHSAEIDLEEELGQRWSTTEFEFVWVDEDDL